MSAVPARPSSPERCSSVAASSAGGIPTCSSSHRTRPGSMLPDRVAMTSPSSGVKPIVVSTERPSRTAASDAPAPRWQVTSRSAIEGSPEELRRAPRCIGVREAVEAVLAQVPALAPLGRDRVGGGRRRHRRRGMPCRSTRPRARPGGRAVTAASAASDFGWWSGARSVRARRCAHDLAVDPDGLRVARSAVDDPVADGVDRPEPADGARHGGGVGQPAGRGQVRRPHDPIVRVEHPELQAARARVDDEDPHGGRPAQRGPGPVPDLGSVLALQARVGPCAQAPVDHQLADVGGPRPEARARGRSRRSRGGTGRGR